MKLESLKLVNFRGFRELAITFDPSFTVLLGGNMAGKTAVLDAAGLALSRLLDPEHGREIDDDEVLQVVVDRGGVPTLDRQLPVDVEARLSDDQFGGVAQIQVTRESSGEPPSHGPFTALRFVGRSGTTEKLQIIRESSGEIPIDGPFTVLNRPVDEPLPLLAYYSVQRHWDRKQPIDDSRGVAARDDAYAGAFDIRSSHSQMVGWIRRQTYVQLQQGNGYVQPQLAAVEAAVKCCIADATRFWFDVQYDEIRIERTGGDIQSLAMLSEGYRNLVVLVADLAWRASVLNPQYGSDANLRTEGIVLIDELDLHLHPAWQRRIVADLRRTFPEVQFIVTTHSPQIVASVARDQIRLLDRNQLIAAEPHVEGRDTNEILEDVFDVARRPESTKVELDEVYQLIEDTRFAEARSRLAGLEERLGPDDAEIVRSKWILDTEDAPPPREPSVSA